MTAEKEIDPDVSLWHLLASEVRKRRKAKGWSQAQLAAESHSSESHVGSIETVARKPMLDTIEAYDRALEAGGSLVSVYLAARRASAGKPLWWEGYIHAEERASRMCMNGPIVLFSIPGRGEVAYLEAMGTGSILTDEQAVMNVECRYDLMRAEALSPRRSAQFLRDLLENL